MINLGRRNLRLVALSPKLGQHPAPGVNNHAVAVADTLVVVVPNLHSSVSHDASCRRETLLYLCSGNDIRLRLDCPCPQQNLPVCFSCGNGEGGREGDDVGAEALQGETDLREAQLDAGSQ